MTEVSGEKAAEALWHEGAILADQGRLEEAREAYAASLALEPTHRAYYELGKVCMRLERFADAKSSFEASLKDLSGHLPMHFELAKANHRLGDFEEAFKELDYVLARAPDHPAARLLTFNMYFELGDWEKARATALKYPEVAVARVSRIRLAAVLRILERDAEYEELERSMKSPELREARRLYEARAG